MKLLKVSGFEGTEFEREALKLNIVDTFRSSDSKDYTKIYYKVPKGRKIYSMYVKESDIQRKDSAQ